MGLLIVDSDAIVRLGAIYDSVADSVRSHRQALNVNVATLDRQLSAFAIRPVSANQALPSQSIGMGIADIDARINRVGTLLDQCSKLLFSHAGRVAGADRFNWSAALLPSIAASFGKARDLFDTFDTPLEELANLAVRRDVNEILKQWDALNPFGRLAAGQLSMLVTGLQSFLGIAGAIAAVKDLVDQDETLSWPARIAETVGDLLKLAPGGGPLAGWVFDQVFENWDTVEGAWDGFIESASEPFADVTYGAIQAGQSLWERTTDVWNGAVDYLADTIYDKTPGGTLDQEIARLDGLLWASQHQVLYHDSTTDHIVVAMGDLESATQILVAIPGTDTPIGRLPGFGEALTTFLQTEGTAVIVWRGYDTPTGRIDAAFYTDEIASGAQPLSEFLRSIAKDGQSITLLGYSAGAKLAQESLISYGAENVDGLVLVSPQSYEPGLPEAMGDRPVMALVSTDDPLLKYWAFPPGDDWSVNSDFNLTYQTRNGLSHDFGGYMEEFSNEISQFTMNF